MAFASSCHEKLSRAWHLGRVPYTDSRAFAMKKLKSCDATESLKKTLELCALVTKAFSLSTTTSGEPNKFIILFT